MELHAMGISYRHDEDFCIDRPDGSGDNLLLIFKTPAFVASGNTEIAVSENSAVVYAKGTPQIYGASGGEYVNHWVHFDCDETDIFFERAGICFDRPFSVGSLASAESLLELLSVESVSEDRRAGECADLLLRLLFLKLGTDGTRTAPKPHRDDLQRLRADIYSTPSGRYKIDDSAAKVLLSPSHFQAAYKAEFGVSFGEDVIRARIAAAKRYLKTTSLSVREIAELCGYENDVHFIRQFKKRTGMTATEFRTC